MISALVMWEARPMLTVGLLYALIATGQPAGPDRDPAKAAPSAEAPDLDRALSEYNALREKAGKSAADQWRLALWCEKNGLKPEAMAHFAEVARLDPRRDAVWRKLGFKKVGGRWTTDEIITEEKEQKAADKVWGPKLRKIHKDLHGTYGPERRAQAQAELDAIRDPKAVLPLYRELGGGRLDQSILIQALDTIDKPIATRLLAFLAVYGVAPEVRKQATLALRTRPAEDYLDLLVGFLVDPISFEIRHVSGPGSPGVLFVEGERFNSARFYAPPAAPDVTPRPGDIVTLDDSGMPLILRPIGSLSLGSETRGVPGSKTLVERKSMEKIEYAAISPNQLQQEAQRGAVAAEVQLRSDEQSIRAINTARRQFNDLVMAVARDASGKDLGTAPRDWRDGLARANKQSPRSRPSPKATVPEVVPLAYTPWFGPSGTFTQVLSHTQVFADS
jgi:hypothetical protein